MAQLTWFKGPAALALDAWYGDGDVEAHLNEAWNLLQSGQSFHQIVDNLGRWDAQRFPHPSSGHVQGAQFERVAGQGYLRAIALALRHSPAVPIKTYWMTGTGSSTFQMLIADEQDRVSVTVVVPDVEEGSEEPGSPEAWLVTVGDDDQVLVTQTSGEGYKEQAGTSAGE
jgi:hypothetical protein